MTTVKDLFLNPEGEDGIMTKIKKKKIPDCICKFFIIKPTRCTNFSNCFWNETTCFGQFLCPSSGVFHCTHSNGICHKLTASAVSKPV